MMASTSSSLSLPMSRFPSWCSFSPLSTFCFFASIETGIATTTLFLFINACLAFAGEAALYFGLLSAIAFQITGHSIPPDTSLSRGLHQLLISIGAYALLGAIFGFFALIKRNLRSAQGLYIVLVVTVVLSTIMAIISLFASAPYSVLLIQLPLLIFNLYLALIARSFVMKLKSDRGTCLGDAVVESTTSINSRTTMNNGGGRGGHGELDTGVSEEDIGIGIQITTNKSSSLSSNAKRTGAGKHISFANGNTSQHKITIGSDLDDENDSGDLSQGSGGLHPALAKVSATRL